MNYEWRLGLRYTRPRRASRFVAFLSVISMAGVALGVVVLSAGGKVKGAIIRGIDPALKCGAVSSLPQSEPR